jgi:hypothetical protein
MADHITGDLGSLNIENRFHPTSPCQHKHFHVQRRRNERVRLSERSDPLRCTRTRQQTNISHIKRVIRRGPTLPGVALRVADTEAQGLGGRVVWDDKNARLTTYLCGVCVKFCRSSDPCALSLSLQEDDCEGEYSLDMDDETVE